MAFTNRLNLTKLVRRGTAHWYTPVNYNLEVIDEAIADLQDDLALYFEDSPSKNLKYDFGAVGDGVVDDTQSLKDALDWARINGGGQILVPPGVYLVGDTVTAIKIYSNTALIGSGMRTTTFLLKPNLEHTGSPKAQCLFSTDYMYNGGASAITFDQYYENVLIKGITFDGNGANQDYPFLAFNVLAGKYWAFHECEFTGWGLDGVQIATFTNGGWKAASESIYCKISNCRSMNNNRGGLTITGGTQNIISDNYVENCGLFGIDVEPATNANCDRNVISRNIIVNVGHGNKVYSNINMNPGTGYADNHIYYHPAIQILANPELTHDGVAATAEYCLVEDNLIDTTGLSATRFWYANNTKVSGNRILNAGRGSFVEISYTVQSGDTANSVAKALSSLINASPLLQRTTWADRGEDPGPGEVLPVGVMASVGATGQLNLTARYNDVQGNKIYYNVEIDGTTAVTRTTWPNGDPKLVMSGGTVSTAATGSMTFTSAVEGDVITLTFGGPIGDCYGLYSYYSTYVEYSNNEVDQALDSGLLLGANSHANYIINNSITNCGQHGFGLVTQNNVVMGNRAINNGTQLGANSNNFSGFYVVGSGNSLFNNLATDTRSSGSKTQYMGCYAIGGFSLYSSNNFQGNIAGVLVEAGGNISSYRIGNIGIDGMDGTLGFGRGVIGFMVRGHSRTGSTGTGPAATNRAKSDLSARYYTPLGYAVNAIDMEVWPDGATDITSALQTALVWSSYNRTTGASTAGAGDLTLHLPAGTYLISSQLLIGSRVTIKGDGPGRTIIKVKDNSTNSSTGLIRAYAAYSGGNDRITIKDLTFDGNSSNQSWDTPYPLVMFANSTNCVLENVEFINCDSSKYDFTFKIDGCTGCIADRLICSGTTGATIKGGSQNIIKDSRMNGLANALVLEGTTDNFITNNRIVTSGSTVSITETGSANRNVIALNNMQGCGAPKIVGANSVSANNII